MPAQSTLETKTVSAACAGRMLGLGKAKTLQLVHSGRLPTKQLDGRIRVRLSDIDAFLKSPPDAAVRP
jgi:excisionase family DNA binding protein